MEAAGAAVASDAAAAEVKTVGVEELTMKVAFWNTRVLDATRAGCDEEHPQG